MENKILEARHKIMSPKIIKSYNDELVSSDEIECFLKREFKSSSKAKILTGGRVSSVYKIDQDGQDKVVKFSTGMYRMIELKREAEVLKYLNNEGYGRIVPNINSFVMLDDFAYLVEDYLEGKTVREKLRINESGEERLKIWEKVGQVLSEIHMLCQDDIKEEWLNGQLEIGRINMENDLLDPEEFQEETPDKVLGWLTTNKPGRKQASLLHGDFRTKNIIVNNENKCNVIDWGFVDIGDPFYDLAVIDYYFKDNFDRESFYKGYKCSKYDKELIEYYDKLSKFVNV